MAAENTENGRKILLKMPLIRRCRPDIQKILEAACCDVDGHEMREEPMYQALLPARIIQGNKSIPAIYNVI